MPNGMQLVLYKRYARAHLRDINSLRTRCGREIEVHHEIRPGASFSFRENAGLNEVDVSSSWYTCCNASCGKIFSELMPSADE